MKIVAAGFECDIRHGAAGASQLGIVVGGADIDAGDGVGRGDNAGQVLDVVVDAFNQIVVALVEPVDDRLEVLLGVEKRRVGPVRPLHSGNQQEQVLIIPVVGHGHGIELLVVDFSARIRPVGLQ